MTKIDPQYKKPMEGRQKTKLGNNFPSTASINSNEVDDEFPHDLNDFTNNSGGYQFSNTRDSTFDNLCLSDQQDGACK